MHTLYTSHKLENLGIRRCVAVLYTLEEDELLPTMSEHITL